MPAIFQTMGPVVNNTFDEQYWGDGKVLLGSPLTFVTGNGGFLSSVWAQQPSLNGDILEWRISLTPGDYRFTVFGQRNTQMGISDFHIVGLSAFLTVDWYDNNFDANFQASTVVTVPTENELLHCITNGQNIGAIGFDIPCMYFSFNKV